MSFSRAHKAKEGQAPPIAFIDLQAQQARLQPKLDADIKAVLDHGKYILGPEVFELEKALAHFSQTDHCITCANGTDALSLALMALDIKQGDCVFVPSFTFIASVEAIILAGATPFFVDVEADSFNVCPSSLERSIAWAKKHLSQKPRAVMSVDLFGRPANYHLIEPLCQENELELIVDAAQSFGAQQNNRHTVATGKIATTSFFPAKPLGCYGDGGAVFTNDAELGAVIRSLANHGQGERKYHHERIGVNSRLDTLQAAILLNKMRLFEEEIALRQKIAQRYIDALEGHCQTPLSLSEQGDICVWAQFTLKVENRDKVQEKLASASIPTAIYYPVPHHQQRQSLECPKDPEGLGVTDYLKDHVLSLPMHAWLEEKQQDYIIAQLQTALSV